MMEWLFDNDIYFKMHCLYNAKTEMYDRKLTDVRDKYDPTSAYIVYSQEIRNASNCYAFRLYQWCKQKIMQETGRPFDVHKWRESIREYWNLSAQGWIDLYNYLVENRKMLDARQIVEHGSSIGDCWLIDLGKMYLQVLNTLHDREEKNKEND